MKHLVLACCLISAPAFAAIDCPATDQGHPLARADGASLYVGDPASNVLLAPTRQARTMAESNVWLLDGSQPVTLVCQYQGSKRASARSVPADIKRCVQNLSANTFACN